MWISKKLKIRGLHLRVQPMLLGAEKPVGRLDCVELEHGFYLARLSLKEDYEAILKKGPWFIGENFLSIRPWELNFRPATVNISSIVVQIRLYELPIEYYNAEVLQQIGRAIGNVLWVDTHMVSKASGRFARMSIQVDVNKPLVTVIMIGKPEQQVCYKGLCILAQASPWVDISPYNFLKIKHYLSRLRLYKPRHQKMKDQSRELLLSFSSQPQACRRWAINLVGIMVEILEVVITKIQANPARVKGWFDNKL
nr:hypothetical protein CFP56_52064 [Quercus suber]